jgi:hypothetical protein
MKSISQIFKHNRELMDEPEVQELIEYCRELEGQVMDRKIDDNYDKEHVILGMLKDILTGIDETLKEDEESVRFNEIPRVDFKFSLINVRKYIREMCYLNRIIL